MVDDRYWSSRMNDPESSGTVKIVMNRQQSVNLVSEPIIYLNGRIIDYEEILTIDMTMVDYIIVNKNGLGHGVRGGSGGVIEVHTNPKFKFPKDRNGSNYSRVISPVFFSSEKRYYAPMYLNTKSRFFINYGVVDWLPSNKINTKQSIVLNVASKDLKTMTLFVEGYINNTSYVSEKLEVKVK